MASILPTKKAANNPAINNPNGPKVLVDTITRLCEIDYDDPTNVNEIGKLNKLLKQYSKVPLPKNFAEQLGTQFGQLQRDLNLYQRRLTEIDPQDVVARQVYSQQAARTGRIINIISPFVPQNQIPPK